MNNNRIDETPIFVAFWFGCEKEKKNSWKVVLQNSNASYARGKRKVYMYVKWKNIFNGILTLILLLPPT